MSDSTKNPSAEEEFENIKVFGQTQIEDDRIPDFDLPESVLAQTIHGYAPGEYASEQVIYKYIIDRDCKLPGSSDNYFLDYDVEAFSDPTGVIAA